MAAKIIDCSYLSATLSDHNPMKMTWEIDAAQSKPFITWRFKSYMLKDPEFIRFMRGHIDVFMETNTNSSSHVFIWEALKAYMRGQILSYSSHKIREKKKTLANLENEIRDLEREHTHTKSEMVLNTLSLKRIQYDNLCTNKAEADLARTNYHYYEFGDKTSKLLAWQIKREESEKTIHSIIIDGRRSLFNPHDINHEFQLFYETLYKTEHGIENTKAKTFLSSLSLPKLDPDDKNCLDANISEREVLEAMKSLQNNKAPGPDGFPIEFFKTFSDKLITPLTNMLNEELTNKTLPSSLELATIILLPKSGKDRQKYTSYRPLSLLNSDYKIISKLIASRMESIIPKIVNADQTGFVKNRYGSDNVRRLFHIIETARSHKDPMLILSMDAEKAFDRIEPSFLFQTLEVMNFGTKFIRFIKTLFNGPKAQILTNGVVSDIF